MPYERTVQCPIPHVKPLLRRNEHHAYGHHFSGVRRYYNSHIKRILAPYHFILRVSLFVVLCAFGYGALTLYGAPFLHHIIAYLPWKYQGAGFVFAFMFIGFLAERRRYI